MRRDLPKESMRCFSIPCAARQNRRSRECQKKGGKRGSKINLVKEGKGKGVLAPMAHHQHSRKKRFNANAKSIRHSDSVVPEKRLVLDEESNQAIWRAPHAELNDLVI